ncbi:MAG TPA: hypothetical protein VMF11_08410 [Candidatus Baltobacteraceae bacterium]|nr:hypothetical protein [Candidatus Baltobacteraceae bacterium]
MSADPKEAPGERLDSDGGDLGEAALGRLRAEGFQVFRATRGERPNNDFVFKSPSEFLSCARELGIRVMFLEAVSFEEGEFFLEDALPAEDIGDGDNVVDLRDVSDGLRVFQRHVGECQLVVLTGCTGSTSISYVEAAHWVEGFDTQRERAIRLVRASSEKAEELCERELERRIQEVTEVIAKLIEDAQFNDTFSSGRPTQGAIVAYIRTTIAGAEDLPSRTLREAANHLRDRLLLKR